MKLTLDLLNKYNTNAPRYTSYPTILDWNTPLSTEQWMNNIRGEVSKGHPVALYIHIPFCKSLCTFCACNKSITQQYQKALEYVAVVKKEFDLYHQTLGVDKIPLKEIHLGGGTPTYLKDAELVDLISHILDKCDITEEHTFSIEVDPRTVEKSQVQTLYDLGFRRMSFGIQDFDEKVQKIINREQSFDCVEDVVNEARRVGFDSLNFDILYGLPNQTIESLDLSMDYIRELSPDRLAFYSYAHVPWFSKAQGHHEKFHLPLGDEKMNLFLYGRQQLLDLGYEEVGMDHFAKPEDSLYKAYESGKLHRNFMGYIEDFVHPLIGLGVSSISDAWSSYVQNKRDIREYQSLINNGEFAIDKSHSLTPVEENSRQHILNLMTQWQTEVEPDRMKNMAGQIDQLVEDKLVEMNGNVMKVSDLGKHFLRNICTLFDDSYDHSKDMTSKFSKTI